MGRIRLPLQIRWLDLQAVKGRSLIVRSILRTHLHPDLAGSLENRDAGAVGKGQPISCVE
jgi:hypothetical protein